MGSGDELLGSGRAFNRGVAQRELDAKGITVVLNTRVAEVRVCMCTACT